MGNFWIHQCFPPVTQASGEQNVASVFIPLLATTIAAHARLTSISKLAANEMSDG